ncbi:MAG TPA: hypothetical protein VLJ21_01175, partial [Candidatus Binatia bacterium]|nr:hypothetical protein [Candidatus Binatia bacterium]
VCDDEKAYLSCTYFWGQFFNFLPFVSLLDNAIKLVQEFLANPFALAAGIISVVCPATCASGTGNTACSLFKVVEIIGRVIEDVTLITQNKGFFKLGNGPCQELKDALKEEKE